MHKVFHFASVFQFALPNYCPSQLLRWSFRNMTGATCCLLQWRRNAEREPKRKSQGGPPEKKRTVVCKGCGESGYQIIRSAGVVAHLLRAVFNDFYDSLLLFNGF
jgi:hypothetical protein